MARERLETFLRDAFPEATELSVEDRTGGGDHFQVLVKSARFDGLALLEQHRLVNEALEEKLGPEYRSAARENVVALAAA